MLSRHAELPVNGTGCKYHRFGRVRAICRDHLFLFSGKLYALHLFLQKCGSECIRMLPEFHREIKSADSGQSGIIVHIIRIDHLSAAHRLFFGQKQ